ncbi:hypothetical protein [Vibrio cholerae]|uniref:hypothetical protein n=1 Tax=Vibrio cholerae TaxID=666 RepID=UPI001668316A|nr:hypothetical protein [Vibrio cholerae]EGR2026956.1 hypothetical protein [Vibrio cholerae]MBD1178501.1 hypothetical protein [Vibrio cholerae]MBJ6945431.1 hypothetical protein [Vibrio cholerae]MCD6704687.1 hypothetical protein [Vibrio cholerae]HDZ9496754.1 hypothetical protein [Vibrio cholerae]
MNQNPFSFYDFLGYMLPGALLLYIVTFVFGVDDMVLKLSLEDANNSTANQLLSFIPAVIFSYLLGHVLAIGSSAFIEAFTQYSNGYPSEFLFDVKPKAYLSSDTWGGQLGRVVLWCLILPISIFKFVLKDTLNIKMFNQAKPLPKPLREAAFNKCLAILDQQIKVDTSKMKIENGIDGDYLRLLYHFVFENSERHAGKLQNYVALYGLTRNVSFVFIVLFWGALYSYFFATQFNIGQVHIFSFAALAYIFYIGFIKFYRRYSLEAVMAASIFSEKNG